MRRDPLAVFPPLWPSRSPGPALLARSLDNSVLPGCSHYVYARHGQAKYGKPLSAGTLTIAPAILEVSQAPERAALSAARSS
eukprot:scaffold3134_cov414-Prasinococcus_capsulatus_cf.AAC.15